MANLIERLFYVPQERQTRLWLLFAFAFSTAGSYVVNRTVADSLFLTRIGPHRLPEMYFISALVVVLISLLYARISARISLARGFQVTLLLLCSGTVSIPILLPYYPQLLPLLGCIYLLAQLRGALGTIQLTTLMNEVFIHKLPARVVGLVGFGSTLAGMIFGGIVGVEADELGTANLLYLVATFDVIGLVILYRLTEVVHPGVLEAHEDAHPLPENDAASQAANVTAQESPWQTIRRSPLAICIALMIGMQTISLTIVEFQWKVAAHNTFHVSVAGESFEEHVEDEDHLTSFFGQYYAVVYAVTGILQLFVTGGYLTRLGILPALLVFPGALMMGSFGILVASPVQVSLGSATITKGCETLRRGIYDAAVYLLYWPMGQLVRRRSIAFSVGVAKPASEALSGLIILELAMVFEVRQLSYFVIALVGCWLSLAVASYRRHLAMGLGKQHLQEPLPEPDPALD
jgi:ATP/ADP translocase